MSSLVPVAVRNAPELPANGPIARRASAETTGTLCPRQRSARALRMRTGAAA